MKKITVVTGPTEAEHLWDFAKTKEIHIKSIGKINPDDVNSFVTKYKYEVTGEGELLTILKLTIPDIDII